MFHMLSTERRRHDVRVLFGDVNYDVRNAHWRENNKIKRKFTLFLMTTINIFISCNENTRENTDVFITLEDNIYGIHSKRVNILYLPAGYRLNVIKFRSGQTAFLQSCFQTNIIFGSKFRVMATEFRKCFT